MSTLLLLKSLITLLLTYFCYTKYIFFPERNSQIAIHLKCLFYFPQSLCCVTRMRMFSVSHKTAFVVDHCPYMAECSRQLIECDMLTKSRSQGVIPLAPVSKSLWTCAIECSMEYCRILFDIYPTNKLVSVWKLELLEGVVTINY